MTVEDKKCANEDHFHNASFSVVSYVSMLTCSQIKTSPERTSSWGKISKQTIFCTSSRHMLDAVICVQKCRVNFVGRGAQDKVHCISGDRAL